MTENMTSFHVMMALSQLKAIIYNKYRYVV